METIRHRVGIETPAQRVHDALTTLEGLATWWTSQVTGDPAEGGKLTFWFGGPDRTVEMEVVSIDPLRQVVWRGIGGPEEWLDTTFTFDLAAADGETVVQFQQAGWREPVDFMFHCSTKWGYYLLSLKHALETGAGTPWPDDAKIDRWG
jgi:uncharacterized protein YndB with AHSA1/START domain